MSLNKSSKYIKNCSLFLLFISLRDEINESKSARKRGKLKGDLNHFCLWMKNFAYKIKNLTTYSRESNFGFSLCSWYETWLWYELRPIGSIKTSLFRQNQSRNHCSESVLKTTRRECFSIYFLSPLSPMGSAHFFSIFQISPVGGVRVTKD